MPLAIPCAEDGFKVKACYEAMCTPPSCSSLLAKAGCGEDSNDSDCLFFSAALSTEERSHPTSSCSTRAYLNEASSPSSLTCEESLASPCNEELLLSALSSPRRALGFERSNSAPLLSSAVACRESVGRMVMHEAQRQWEVRPSCSYLERHHISEDMRRVAVRWLAEVTTACNLKPATLVLATSYFDRFLSVAKDVSSCMLQLIAVAALSLATKQEETLQPTLVEWAGIADNTFSVQDLARMEWIVFHHLSWRGRTPTALSFLNLFCCGLDIAMGDAFKAARYLVEISILDFQLLHYDYSTVAAAALLIAHQTHHLTLNIEALVTLAPFLSLPDVDACCKVLWAVHMQASQQQAAQV